jgi:hypothetical protein
MKRLSKATRVTTVGVLNKIQPMYEIRHSGEEEEKPKQSYLEKTKKPKPNTKKQMGFFYSSIV